MLIFFDILDGTEFCAEKLGQMHNENKTHGTIMDGYERAYRDVVQDALEDAEMVC